MPPSEDSPPVDPDGIKKRSRRRKNAKPTKHCIPKLAFRRLMQEIVADNKSDMRLQQEAVDALQEAAESLVTERFQKCSQLAELCNLDTVRADHWHYVRDADIVTPVQ
jgi:histone H3/H4